MISKRSTSGDDISQIFVSEVVLAARSVGSLQQSKSRVSGRVFN